MAFEEVRFLYRARRNTTGLSDVKAAVRVAGALVAQDLVLTEVNALEFPGVYELRLTTLQVSTWGAGFYQVHIDSDSKKSPAISGKYVTEFDSDDVKAAVDGVETKVDSITSDVATLGTNLTSVKATVEDSNDVLRDAAFGNANIKAMLDSIQGIVSNISNVTRFTHNILPQMVRDDNGSKTYKVMGYLQDTNGNMEDPEADHIELKIFNTSGADRRSLIDGYTSGAFFLTRDAQGKYSTDITIPANATLEPLDFEFRYVENGKEIFNTAKSEIVTDVQLSGLALETTAQQMKTKIDDMQPRVTNIQSLVSDATFGLSALKDLIDAVGTSSLDAKNLLSDAGFGLSALKSTLDTKASQSSVVQVQQTLDNDIKGTGFDNTKHTMEKIAESILEIGGQVI